VQNVKGLKKGKEREKENYHRLKKTRSAWNFARTQQGSNILTRSSDK